MRKPTPSEIKANGVLGPYFFSRPTMAFFNQTMRDFKTEWFDKGKGIVRLYASRGYFVQTNPLGGRKFIVDGMTKRFIQITPEGFRNISGQIAKNN